MNFQPRRIVGGDREKGKFCFGTLVEGVFKKNIETSKTAAIIEKTTNRTILLFDDNKAQPPATIPDAIAKQ